jgi:D-glycero-D-manno-heptose 1,7-bisphosphate phosphatase
MHARRQREGRRRRGAAVPVIAARSTADAARAAVFLDRDGTMIEDRGYLARVDEVAFFPWTIDAIRSLNAAGLPVIVITNQSGIARGYMKETDVEAIHRHVTSVVEAGGARIDGYYYCPHHPDGTVAPYAIACDCRKPGAAMIERAAREHRLDPARSFVVGDTGRDVGLGCAVGARSILVRTGYGAEEERRGKAAPADAIVDNLAAAASWILQHL